VSLHAEILWREQQVAAMEMTCERADCITLHFVSLQVLNKNHLGCWTNRMEELNIEDELKDKD